MNQIHRLSECIRTPTSRSWAIIIWEIRNSVWKQLGWCPKYWVCPVTGTIPLPDWVKICKEGETAVRAALHELIDERYVYLEKLPPNYSKADGLNMSITSMKFHMRIFLMVWNVRNCFSKSSLKQIKTQMSQIQKNKIQKTCILKIQDVENQGQLNTYISKVWRIKYERIKWNELLLRRRKRRIRRNMRKLSPWRKKNIRSCRNSIPRHSWISALRFSTTTSFPAENDTSQIITPF